jgi:hypothetical protein
MAALTSIALAAAVVGTGVAVYGQVQQAKTAKAVGAYNAKLAENQALQAEMDAAENTRRKRKENRRLLATQRSRLAKAGVMEAGTPLEVMAETAGNLELETLDYARSIRMQASGLRAQGAMDRVMGSAQARAAYIGAGASLLSGASSVAGMSYEFQQSGAFTPTAAGSGTGTGTFKPATLISGTSVTGGY